MVRKEDASMKRLLIRKSTHADQDLNFTSYHPLLDTCNNIVSGSEEIEKEVEHITTHKKGVSTQVGPNRRWTNSKVRKKDQERKDNKQGVVTLP